MKEDQGRIAAAKQSMGGMRKLEDRIAKAYSNPKRSKSRIFKEDGDDARFVPKSKARPVKKRSSGR